MDNIGRPEYTDEQYENWLDDMRPFLKIGYTLHSAMEKAWIIQHKNVIYQKYRLNDWFREKIDAYRSYVGETINSIFARQVYMIEEKQKRGEVLTDEDWRNLRFLAEKHRSCQPFFINRQEVTQVEPDKIGEILDRIELGNKVSPTDYSEVAEKAKQEMAKSNQKPSNNTTASEFVGEDDLTQFVSP